MNLRRIFLFPLTLRRHAVSSLRMKTALEIRKAYGLSNSSQSMVCQLLSYRTRLFPKGRIPKTWTPEQEQALADYQRQSAAEEKEMFLRGALR